MKFEEMQTLWHTQDDKNLYTIDEEIIHDYIHKKGRSITWTLNLFEIIMIAVNFITGIYIIIQTDANDNITPQLFTAAVLLTIAIYNLGLRLKRHQDTPHFPPTLLGDLERSLWNINYLFAQMNKIMRYYVLPLIIVFAVNFYFNDMPWWSWSVIIIWALAAYYGGRWEIRKFHRPKKDKLEALHQQLLNQQTPTP
ncbi:MAG TPA: hypothetical protein VLL52_05790 [Anaerolineae bacterium]|nr:hypothetical protein [Anaerolineae bacterium]